MLRVTFGGTAPGKFAEMMAKVKNLRAMRMIWGKIVERKTKDNAEAKGGEHFWQEVSDSVRLAEIGPDGIAIEVTHVAAAQKQYGGEIRAKVARALTIPIDPMAKGKRVGELAMILAKPIFRPKGKDYLAVEDGGRIVPLYLLRASVFQNPDPFLPDADWCLEQGTAIAEHFIMGDA